MKDVVTYAAVKDWLLSLALTQPRILVLCAMLPIFSKQILPGRLRGAVVVCLGLIVTPLLFPNTSSASTEVGTILLLMLKEAFIGLVLGYLVAIPFWVFEAMGAVIDYQRGASMGAILNPAMGTDATPLAILFQLAYGVYFLGGDGLHLMLSMLYDSYRLWDPWQWHPVLHMDAIPLLIGQLDRLMRLVMLFAAPAVVIMLLSEIGLALASRFTPQLQVFFLAMPIKTALALFVLVASMGAVFRNAAGETAEIGRILPFLTHIWRPQ